MIHIVGLFFFVAYSGNFLSASFLFHFEIKIQKLAKALAPETITVLASIAGIYNNFSDVECSCHTEIYGLIFFRGSSTASISLLSKNIF